ncbi:hypothetical protein F4604DRAFT_1684765 [Suillus subluteus]|nr:hypothetical protein F4604DRAFT_1684765 [Suillus subluteus]
MVKGKGRCRVKGKIGAWHVGYSPSYVMKEPLVFAYYCSGHGYGHATWVSAFARHLLNLDSRMTIHIVSSAPKHVFNDSISLGALYHFAEIDPVIVQPVVLAANVMGLPSILISNFTFDSGYSFLSTKFVDQS